LSSSPARKHIAVVPVAVCDHQTQRALSFARTLAPKVLAMLVRSKHQYGRAFEEMWAKLEPQVPLVILDAPSSDAQGQLVRAIDVLRRAEETELITVVIPQNSPEEPQAQWAPHWADTLLRLPGIVVRNTPTDEWS
jgi:hypothetical protein